MSQELQPQPKDEREVSLKIEVGTGAFLPGGKIELGFKRAWQKRAEKYLDSVATAANVDEDLIIDTIAEGEGFSDVFADGLALTTGESSDEYRRTFAYFVANALNDPAKVDISSFLLEKFGKLKPPHVRVFWNICQLIVEAEKEELRRRQEERQQREDARRQEALRQEEEERRRAKYHLDKTSPDETEPTEIEASHNAARLGSFASGSHGIVVGDNYGQIVTTNTARGQYIPSLWLKATIELRTFSEALGLPQGVVTSLLRDLYNEGIIGDESPTEIGVTEVGKLAYEAVGESGISHIISRHPGASAASSERMTGDSNSAP
jgi:hypothetical protein